MVIHHTQPRDRDPITMRAREHFLCERTGKMDTSLIFWVSDFCDCSFALAGPNNHWLQPKSEELHLHWPLYVKMDRVILMSSVGLDFIVSAISVPVPNVEPSGFETD